MKSAGKVLLEACGITGTIRPARIEQVITSLLLTINKHDALKEAMQDIIKNTEIPLEDIDITSLATLTLFPELVAMYNDEKAIKLFIELIPTISNTITIDSYVIADDVLNNIINRSSIQNKRREVKRVLDKINNLPNDYKVFQDFERSSDNTFYIIKVTNREEVIKYLTEADLLSTTTLDIVLKDID